MYFYRLGHNHNLAHAEFVSLSGGAEHEIDGQWLVSSANINTQNTGSLIFGGKVIIKHVDPHHINVINALTEYQQQTEIKKIGVAILGKFTGKHIQFFKDAGFKKINMIHKIPTHGNLKHTRNWLIIYPFKGETVFATIEHYANQQFWSDIDMNMPAQNMDRGMINLKLARSMTNLRDNHTGAIWDPLGGLGRNLVASLDLVNKAWISDKDLECEDQAKANINHALKYSESKRLKVDFHLEQAFTHSIEKPLPPDLEKNLVDAQVSIVTEGYLGQNLARSYTQQTFEKQVKPIEDMWNHALIYWSSLGIAEVIFCLPFLQSQGDIVSPNLPNILKDTNYTSVTFPHGETRINYARPRTVVGHSIIKLKLNT